MNMDIIICVMENKRLLENNSLTIAILLNCSNMVIESRGISLYTDFSILFHKLFYTVPVIYMTRGSMDEFMLKSQKK